MENQLLQLVEKLENSEEGITEQDKYDICASFQKTAVDHIMQKLKKQFKQKIPKNFAIVGGASANIYLRAQIDELCKKHNMNLYLSELKYCADNAAMIGRVAVEQYKQNDFISIDEIDVQTRIKEF